MSAGLLLIRLVFGVLMAGHGAQKLFGWLGGHGIAGTGQFFEGIGFRPGSTFAAVAGLAESVGGVLLLLGLVQPLAAILIISVMTTAIGSVHLGRVGGPPPLMGRKCRFCTPRRPRRSRSLDPVHTPGMRSSDCCRCGPRR
jgi:putative oxidoreductase